jgi:ethanolamine ammonia-lyase large subunit
MDRDALRRTLTLASAFKEGDRAVGGGHDPAVRREARQALLATTIGDIHRTTLVDDGVSEALARSRDRSLDGELGAWTVSRLRDVLLGRGAAEWAAACGPALGSEAVAAVAKVMTRGELGAVARALAVSTGDGPRAVGGGGHFGSRIQPNSPGDDEQEILYSIFEGLARGCGDVVIGLNPAADDLDTIVRLEQLLEQVVRRLELPTRFCVLSDLVKQHAAQRHTTVDVGFQSLAGTSRALTGMVGLDVDGVADLARAFGGLYFETGQGSEVTNGAAEGVDMGTLEARTYGVARHVRQRVQVWTIVNDVAGFIGPEVFVTAGQLERVCLEDVVMARLHGLTMGLDVCATFHMGIAPGALRQLTARIVERAAPAYLMAVAGNADPMLGYLTTSFREHPALRRLAGRSATEAMRRRLDALGVRGDDAPAAVPDVICGLSARFARAGGDRRSDAALEAEARRQLAALQEQGWDLGLADTARAEARVESLYEHARAALYATIDGAVIRDAATSARLVRTVAAGRDEYLATPACGERLRDEDARAMQALYPLRRPQVQLVISDGLNANAVNDQLRAILPGVRQALVHAGHHVGEHDVVVRNGRVRAGYDVGLRTGADVIVHLIGERPGTGLNTLSAYVTYGRDVAGALRWSSSLPHSATTAVCGIHVKGKPPGVAVAEVARVVGRVVAQRRSGVALDPA